MTTITSTITSLKDAIESRDADGITAWYADNAVLTILDRDNLPAAPATYRGLEEISAYYRDICGRNMEHSVEDLISTADGLGYTQRCRYPDGTRVVCVTVARLVDGKITRQTVVQVWDTPSS
jgi:ketosteroid isomerase-like protein